MWWENSYIPDGMDPEEYFRMLEEAHRHILVWVAPIVSCGILFIVTVFW